MRTAAVIVALLVLTTACGKSDKIPSTQVAAKVNGSEISIHLLNYGLSRLGAVPESEAKQAQKRVLESLVDQQLLIQKAQERKLDRDPRIVQALEAAKRQILSQAYLETVMASNDKVAPTEYTNYYTEHPEVFSERKIYHVFETALSGDVELLSKLEAQVKKAKNMNDVTAWLGAQKIVFNVASSTKPAEQLPLDLLPVLSRLKENGMEVVTNRAKSQFVVVQVLGTQAAPIEQKAAQPFIERILQNQKRSRAVENEVKQLRTTARIEYVGDFAPSAQMPAAPSTASAKNPPPVVETLQSAASAAQPASAVKKESGATAENDFMNKGLSDLK